MQWLIGKKVAVFICAAVGTIAPTRSGYTAKTEPFTLKLSADVTNTERGFKKFVIPFLINKDDMYFTGLKGALSLSSSRHAFSMALFTLRDLDEAQCPEKVEAFKNFADLNKARPHMRNIDGYILKKTAEGMSIMDIDLSLQGNIKIKKCLLLIIDGGSNVSEDPVRMVSTLSATFEHNPRATPDTIINAGDEFIFRGKAASGLAFRRVVRVKARSNILALYGNISDAGPNQTPTNDAWSTRHSYYVFKGCDIPEGQSGPKDFFAKVPADAIDLLTLSQTRVGMGVAETPVFKRYRNVEIDPEDCLVHLVGANTGRNLDMESQVRFLVRDKR